MITEIVTFPLPEGMTREQVIAAFRDSTPNWRGNPDLIRKHYLYDSERRIGGGVYLWKSIEDARRWHGDAFKERIARVYGSGPAFAYFETPIVIDNEAGEVVEAGAEG